MTAALTGVGLFAVLVVLPGVIGRWRGVSPRVAAGAYLVDLVGWGLLPAVWLGCLGGTVGSWLAGIRVTGGGCLFGLEKGQWQLAGYLPAAGAFGVLVWHAVRLAVTARRSELRGVALAGSTRRGVAGGGEVWVVPSARPAAFAGGLWRCRAVVTSAVLAPLDEVERQAVCEHEAAHVRLGHPRVLVAGGAVAGAYGWLSPVRRGWDGLRRESEAAADDEAAGVVGRAAVISALVKVALLAGGASTVAAFGGGTVAFGDVDHLRYRIARLEDGRAVRAAPTALVGSTAAFVVSVMAWSACVLAGADATTVGIVACGSAIAAVGLRPTWAWGLRIVGR
ncbi:MAG: M48 family metalloprotease [Acidimicrobiales bacterium]